MLRLTIITWNIKPTVTWHNKRIEGIVTGSRVPIGLTQVQFLPHLRGRGEKGTVDDISTVSDHIKGDDWCPWTVEPNHISCVDLHRVP